MCIKDQVLSFQEILFSESFQVILKNSKLIIETPEFYNCKPNFIGMSNPHAAPYLTLGKLCQLWKEGEFICKCNNCGSISYIISGGGNLGGGISAYSSICPNCKQIIWKKGPDIGPSIYMPLLHIYMDFNKNMKFVQSSKP